ncbi:hypothetical protein BCR36DRAFT_338452 [Piromyces finnis]|uniref:Alpha/beta-hydrolase n=1 Tax=Piromyces finnis TaxID=1754191 RepID=A0A1Y1UWC7_9FUNG|nr:hypothetical protein BCR36DRAFT_338452 [Piromyces finnis]|eukprot:ORX41913.1 hypothetical protein BCR36DRAFT_338452 [Piromyces finnis]
MINKNFVNLFAFALLILSTFGKKCYVTKPKPVAPVDAKNAVNAQMIVQGYEWGPAVPKIIVEFEDDVTGFDKDTFLIKTANTTREIIDVYNSDKEGKETESASKYVSFDLKVGTLFIEFMNSSVGDASPFTYDFVAFVNKWAESFELELDLAEGKSFKIGDFEYGNKNEWTTYKKDLMKNFIVPETAVWKKDSFTNKSDKITLQRASFTPKGAATDGVKNPLIIWLHGAGEGGVDTDIPLLGNEVVALSREGEIQKYFTTEKQKGAYVLIVQTPTMWMDKGDGTYNDDIPAGEKQKSYYDAALFAAIKDYVESNDDIDTKRIYLGGCSNGGYMTMNLMFEHGDFFTAFYPICEAYMNKNISDEMIEQVKDYNIWFLQSEDDTTVDPLMTTIPSFYRLINAGAKNVHFTLKDHVKGVDDASAVYMGHYSWVYAFNDDVKEQFDNAKVLEDYDNITIEEGVLTSKDNYVTNANCSKDGNMWAWLASQTK